MEKRHHNNQEKSNQKQGDQPEWDWLQNLKISLKTFIDILKGELLKNPYEGDIETK